MSDCVHCGHMVRIHKGNSAEGWNCRGHNCTCHLPGFFETNHKQREQLARGWVAAHAKTKQKLDARGI